MEHPANMNPATIAEYVRNATRTANQLRDLAQALDGLAQGAAHIYYTSGADADGIETVRETILECLRQLSHRPAFVGVYANAEHAQKVARAYLGAALDEARALDIDHPARIALENANI